MNTQVVLVAKNGCEIEKLDLYRLENKNVFLLRLELDSPIKEVSISYRVLSGQDVVVITAKPFGRGIRFAEIHIHPPLKAYYNISKGALEAVLFPLEKTRVQKIWSYDKR